MVVSSTVVVGFCAARTSTSMDENYWNHKRNLKHRSVFLDGEQRDTFMFPFLFSFLPSPFQLTAPAAVLKT